MQTTPLLRAAASFSANEPWDAGAACAAAEKDRDISPRPSQLQKARSLRCCCSHAAHCTWTGTHLLAVQDLLFRTHIRSWLEIDVQEVLEGVKVGPAQEMLKCVRNEGDYSMRTSWPCSVHGSLRRRRPRLDPHYHGNNFAGGAGTFCQATVENQHAPKHANIEGSAAASGMVAAEGFQTTNIQAMFMACCRYLGDPVARVGPAECVRLSRAMRTDGRKIVPLHCARFFSRGPQTYDGRSY